MKKKSSKTLDVFSSSNDEDVNSNPNTFFKSKTSKSDRNLMTKMQLFSQSNVFSESEFTKMGLAEIWSSGRLSNKLFSVFSSFCESMIQKFLRDKIYKSEFVRFFLRLHEYQNLFTSEFLNESVPALYLDSRNQNVSQVCELCECFSFMLILVFEIFELFSTLLDVDAIKTLLMKINALIQEHLETAQFALSEAESSLKEKLENLQTQIDDIEEKIKSLENSENSIVDDQSEEADFEEELVATNPKYLKFLRSAGRIQNISIYPTFSDLSKTSKIPLNPLKINHRFADCTEYLETHFRLIREDFIQALREGFHIYKQNLESDFNLKNFNVSIFENVSIIK